MGTAMPTDRYCLYAGTVNDAAYDTSEEERDEAVAGCQHEIRIGRIAAKNALLGEDTQALRGEGGKIDREIPQRRIGAEHGDMGQDIAGIDRMPKQAIRSSDLHSAICREKPEAASFAAICSTKP